MNNGGVRCAITGARGYLGSAITQRLQADGIDVLELTRSGEPSQPGRRAAAYQLGGEIDPAVFAGVDALVHCAYDFAAHSWRDIERINVQGSSHLFAAAHAGGVRRIILISTISAFPGCRSLYGRAKLQIEQDAAKYGAAVVRPGLVYDSVAPRGVVGALGQVVQRSPIVPLVGGGKQVLYPCHVDDLTHLISVLCTSATIPEGVPIIAASPHGMTFRAILDSMARQKGKSPHFIPVPATPILWMLRMAEQVGVRSRLRSDSLVSLMNQSRSVDFGELVALGTPFRDLK